MKKTTRPQTRQCAECQFASWSVSFGDVNGTLLCAKNHKPRFYKPKDLNDTEWGWKRKCKDFQPTCF